jgi:hypothetical protein
VLSQELLRNDPDDDALERVVINLRVCTHWFAAPAYPVLRWGWAGVAAMWAIGVGGVLVLSHVAPALVGAAGVLYLAWVVHSWTFQPILRRWIRWRGV